MAQILGVRCKAGAAHDRIEPRNIACEIKLVTLPPLRPAERRCPAGGGEVGAMGGAASHRIRHPTI
jgi:hypothetical protein